MIMTNLSGFVVTMHSGLFCTIQLGAILQGVLMILNHKTSVRSLTHWGRVTHICVSDLTSIGSDNGLSSGRRQTIIRNNAGILLIRPLGTNFNEFSVEILIFSFKKMRLKVSSAKRRPFCLGLYELNLLLYIPWANKSITQITWLLACHEIAGYWETELCDI